jgi:hypothetical protein
MNRVIPTPGFDIPPYKVGRIGGTNADTADTVAFYYVENANGFNCLHYLDYPGRKFTTQAEAMRICSEWNKTSKQLVRGNVK